MRAVLLGLCLGAALGASNIELRSGGQTATITFDGATLTVPQQCRASTCSGIHDDIFAMRRDIAENTRFTESVRDALLAENAAARADMAEMRALLVAEDRARTAADAALREETAGLRARNAALASELAAAVQRLDALQMRHTESVAALTKADEAAAQRLKKLDRASQDADSVLKQSIERLAREQEAETATLAAADASIAQQSGDADAALTEADAALAAKLASLAKHSKSAHDELVRAIAAVHAASEAAITAVHDESVDRDETLLDKTAANAQGVSANTAAVAAANSASLQRDSAIVRTGQAAAKELAGDVESNAQDIAAVHRKSVERDAALHKQATEIGAAVERQADDISRESQLSLARDRTLRAAIEATRDDVVARHEDVLGRHAELAQRADAIVEMVEDRAAAISNEITAKHGQNAGRINALDEKVQRNAEDIAADAKAALARDNVLLGLVNAVSVKLADEQRLSFAKFCALLGKMTEMDERLTGEIKGESLQREQAVKRMMGALATAVDEVVGLQVEADVALAAKLRAEVQSAVRDEAQARAAAINAERAATASKLAAKASLADMEKAIAAAQKEQGEDVQRKLGAAEARVNAAMADQRSALEALAAKETDARHKQFELLRAVDLPALRKKLQDEIKARNTAVEAAMRAERVDAIAVAQIQVLSHVSSRIDEITPKVSRALDAFQDELDALSGSGLDEAYVQGQIAAATESLHKRIVEVNRDQKTACKEGYERSEDSNGVAKCAPCPAGHYCTGGVRKRLYGAGSCAGAPKAAGYTGTLYTGCKSDGSADNAADNTAVTRCDRQIQCKYKEGYSSSCPYTGTCYKNCNCKNRDCCGWFGCYCNWRCDSCSYSCTLSKDCTKYRFVYRTP